MIGRPLRAGGRRHAAERLAIVAAGIALATIAAVAPRHAQPERLALTAAHGTLELVDSSADEAVMSVSNLAPGRSATGTVNLSNAGTMDGGLLLSSAAPLDRPGPGGGELADRLELRIDALGAPPSLVASGTLRGLAGCHSLGVLPAGATRTYRFTAWLPDGGVRDNALQRSATSVNETWALSPSGCGQSPAISSERDFAPRIRVRRARACRHHRRRIQVRVRTESSLRRVVVVVDGRRLLVTQRRRFTLHPVLARRRNRLVVRAWDAAGREATRRTRLQRCS